MPTIDRRVAPRKKIAVPLQFRVTNSSNSKMLKGLTSDVSEHGVYFTTEYDLALGAPLEMSFSVPQELTGRRSEEVCCIGRVVHVERHIEANDVSGVGVQIERYEPAGAILREN